MNVFILFPLVTVCKMFVLAYNKKGPSIPYLECRRPHFAQRLKQITHWCRSAHPLSITSIGLHIQVQYPRRICCGAKLTPASKTPVLPFNATEKREWKGHFCSRKSNYCRALKRLLQYPFFQVHCAEKKWQKVPLFKKISMFLSHGDFLTKKTN